MLSNNTSEKRDDLNMKSKINKQNIFLIILLIILIFIILGISYAFLQTSFFASKDSVLKVGSLSLVLDESEGNAITVSADGPLSDNEGVNLDNYYSFKITNNGKYLDDQPLDEGDVRIDQKYVHYSLERNDSNNVAKSLTGNQKLESGIINSGQTINYKLRLWFSNDMTAEEENKVFNAKLRIEASQNINTMASSLKLSSKEKQTITKIVFQNKINDIENTTKSYDLSSSDNNSVIGKIVSNGDSTNTLYIQSNGEIFANSNSRRLFYYLTELKSIENLNFLNTSQVTDMGAMFERCKKLSDLNLNNFDTSNVVNMSTMFGNCKSLISLNLSSFNTSNVTNMNGMFSMWNGEDDKNSSGSLEKLDLSNFDTSKVVNMDSMFAFSTNLVELNISSFDTSSVTNMYHMFNRCDSLTKLNLKSATFDKVTNYEEMFYNIPSDINIITKDTTTKSWLEDRLKGKGTVTIG